MKTVNHNPKSSNTSIPLDDDIGEAIDKFSCEEIDKPSRPEAVRRILKDWLIGHGYLPVEPEED